LTGGDLVARKNLFKNPSVPQRIDFYEREITSKELSKRARIVTPELKKFG
jgi:hypothetical protein